MKTTTINLLFAGLISGIMLTSCSKNDVREMSSSSNVAANPGRPAVTTAAILNKDLKIINARDNGVDITDRFQDFTFNFTGNYPGGPAHVWNDLLAQTGSWSSAFEATDFTISYPTGIVEQLAFLNRTWNIEAPSTTFFRLTSTDGDVVELTTKDQ